MQPTATLDIQRSGDLGGHKVAMKIDENSIAHIMSVLTDLYSDPEMAIIREYSTNAWDAHVEAGNTAPIEVFTPTSLSPFFRVKDYGIGLDLEGIEKIYSQYGASTKRSTDEQTGMLGLGCKSALTYTNQFTLIAVKDGIKTSVMVSRVEDGTGVMEVLFQKPTDEPNGVEVVIPVRYSETFDTKAKDFFSYWEPGRVLVNGQQPEFLYGKGKRLGTSDIYMVPDKKYGTKSDVVIMGGVPYPVKEGLSGAFHSYAKAFSVVAVVPIGSVNFPPSREALHYTARTNETLEKVRKEFATLIKTTIQADIDSSKDNAEAIGRYHQWLEMVPNMGTGYTYNGNDLVFTYKVADKYHSWDRYASRHAMSNGINSADYKFIMKALVVVDFDFEKVTVTQRRKVSQWIESQGGEHPRYVMFVKELPGAPWTDDAKVVKYDVIKALRLPSNSAGRKARVAKYDVLNDSGYAVETDDIDDSQNVYCFSPKEWKESRHVLKALFPDDVLVSIGINRQTKFLRDFPNAKPLTTGVLRKRLTEVRDMLTEEDKIYLSLHSWDKRNLERFDGNRFDDPELSKYVNSAKVKPSGALALFQTTVNRLNSMGHYGWQEMKIDSKPSPFGAYPLIGRVDALSGTLIEHVYTYCNAVYNSKEK